jgi:membrane protein YdbS with pleckstrin-like domain
VPAVASPVRDPAWQVSRGAIGLWVTEGLIGAVVLALGAAAFLLFVPSSVGGPVPFLRWAVPVLVIIDAVVTIGVRPRLRYRVHRWEVTDEAVYTLTGWLSRTWT